MSPKSRNHRVSATEGEMSCNNTGDKILVFSYSNSQTLDDDSCDRKMTMITIDPNELVGRKFLNKTEEDRESFQARVVKAIIDI
jgi:hypothetical protein